MSERLSPKVRMSDFQPTGSPQRNIFRARSYADLLREQHELRFILECVDAPLIPRRSTQENLFLHINEREFKLWDLRFQSLNFSHAILSRAIFCFSRCDPLQSSTLRPVCVPFAALLRPVYDTLPCVAIRCDPLRPVCDSFATCRNPL